jgi:hypothetical protein
MKYLSEARKSGLSASDRGKLLEHNEELASQHRKFAEQGSTAAPQTLEEEMAVNLHFVALVPGRDGKSLWELDGRKAGPVLRAMPDKSTGFVPESLKLIKQYMERGNNGDNGNTVEYSVIALVPSLSE